MFAKVVPVVNIYRKLEQAEGYQADSLQTKAKPQEGSREKRKTREDASSSMMEVSYIGISGSPASLGFGICSLFGSAVGELSDESFGWVRAMPLFRYYAEKYSNRELRARLVIWVSRSKL